MATLVFSTVGNAFGGPVGGAIGALIGQSLDQQLLSPPRRGPRLGDLSVQTSSYGTQIPRIYGSMRVAGSVVWATDLIESEQTNGAKGQPDASYSYSVSLAIALSSRVAGAIGRIWADGQLLRGAAGDFKVPTTFRFYNGGEDQVIDPMIASIEGITNTPAYRGLALAVFENLQLATFGNRIPFITFEVLADPAAPSLSAILADVSDGSVGASAADAVLGYAAYGSSIARAIEPLVSTFGLQLFDDGAQLRESSSTITIGPGELGNSAGAETAPEFDRERLGPEGGPATLRLSYYDQARDYQAGEARASAGSQGMELQQDLPVVLDADQAKAAAHSSIVREWAALDRLTLRLPPSRLNIEPGTIVRTSAAAGSWVVEKTSIEAFVTIAELRPDTRTNAAIAADAGRAVASRDVVETAATLAMIDIVDVTGSGSNTPRIAIAASCVSEGWRPRPLSVAGAGVSFSAPSSGRKSILGRAVTVLPNGRAELIDQINSVDVELIDPDQWLTNCDEEALGSGENLAVLGREVLQFGTTVSLGGGRFRLSQLLRARGGTDWATGTHVSGEDFCLLDPDRLSTVEMPVTARGSTLRVQDDRGAFADAQFNAETVRPLSPVNLEAALNPAGGLDVSWTRRSRAGFAWLDEVDAPIGESSEQYRVVLTGPGQRAEFACTAPDIQVDTASLTKLGSGMVQIEVVQLGDFAASRAAVATIAVP